MPWSRAGLRLAAKIVLGFVLAGASAQNYSVDWYKIAGGGGTSANGQFTVRGTIGQPDAGGPMTGGSYSVEGGFWSFIATGASDGTPPLNIRYSGGTVTVYWQNVSGWTLQQNASLVSPAAWSPSSGVTTANGTNYLSFVPSGSNLFFRLKKQ
jgi:hypothetical protein